MQQHLMTAVIADDRRGPAGGLKKLERHLHFIDTLVAQGGPDEADYETRRSSKAARQ